MSLAEINRKGEGIIRIYRIFYYESVIYEKINKEWSSFLYEKSIV